ncbi:unnamed protein product [Leptidea sinapis]|uniref:Uncharacterized protein n=1 Tax=Leptidea sinapis TaxID=189913 RepID=A0A5E4QRP9_9NEOP|nr:unnamed protein product [Leptidea sinapis]
MDTSDLPNTLYSSIKRNPLKLVKMADISGGPYTTPLHLNTEEKTARFHNVTDAPRNYCEAVQTQSDAATNTQLHTQR